MRLPNNITPEAAFILGYEQGFAEATQVDSDPETKGGLTDGTILPDFEHDRQNELWTQLVVGDEIVRIAGGWLVDNGRAASGSRWRNLVPGIDHYNGDETDLPGNNGFESVE